MPKLTIFLPDQEPLKVGFEDQIEINIGRASDNDIVVAHESMSGHHAQLKLVGNHYILVDLDSTNGTFLEGAPVSQAPLQNGSKITFGRVEAEFEAEESEGLDDGSPSEDGSDDFGGGGGSGFESTIHAAVAQQSLRPANFRNLSPIERTEKKDSLSTVAMVIGLVGLVAGVAVAGVALMMKI